MQIVIKVLGVGNSTQLEYVVWEAKRSQDQAPATPASERQL